MSDPAIQIQRKVPLAPFTTFHIGGPAEYFTRVATEAELLKVIAFAKENNMPVTVLGGGSNVLVSDEGVKGLVIKNEIGGIEYRDAGDQIFVTAGAGVVWDELVWDTVARGFWGLENLSLIPGTVGATPVQNVGAYGVEVAERIVAVTAYDTKGGASQVLDKEACAFMYRDSRFKHSEGKRFIVTAVTYLLTKDPRRVLAYKDLALRFKDKTPTLREIRDAVIAIRSGKFPNYTEVGTAGSFFKNPIVTEAAFNALVAAYPDMPSFPDRIGYVKIPLGWILEHILGVKGIREGNVGTYNAQALVIVNHKDATAREVDAFASRIEALVFERMHLTIEREVSLIS